MRNKIEIAKYVSLVFVLIVANFHFLLCVLTVTCMWRSRLRATFLSNRYEVEAGDEPTFTHKTGYDIYRLLGVCALF